MANEKSKLMGALRFAAIAGVLGFVLTMGRSCGTASHEVPETSGDEVVWIATFNGL